MITKWCILEIDSNNYNVLQKEKSLKIPTQFSPTRSRPTTALIELYMNSNSNFTEIPGCLCMSYFGYLTLKIYIIFSTGDCCNLSLWFGHIQEEHTTNCGFWR